MNGQLQLGETIRTLDPAVALQGEYGTFRVTTPNNEDLLITCQHGHSIASVQWANQKDKRPFQVTKIMETVAGAYNPTNPPVAV